MKPTAEPEANNNDNKKPWNKGLFLSNRSSRTRGAHSRRLNGQQAGT